LIEQFVTAIAGRPFGTAGFLRVRSLSGERSHIARLRTVAVRSAAFGERVLAIEECREAGDALLVKFVGVDNPEAARILNGAQLIVPRADAAPRAPNEFYIEDLKGLTVVDENGAPVGEIADVIEGGGGFLVEVACAAGEKRLVPFRSEFFGEISLENRSARLVQTWILA
jgi:16S rRNA processing protein RimM